MLDKEVILYGDIPAISYIFDLRSAVYTTWADLDSNPLGQLKEELESETLRQKKPLLIVSAEASGRLEDESAREKDQKLAAIYRYLSEMEYEKTYASTQYCIYEAP